MRVFNSQHVGNTPSAHKTSTNMHVLWYSNSRCHTIWFTSTCAGHMTKEFSYVYTLVVQLLLHFTSINNVKELTMVSPV